MFIEYITLMLINLAAGLALLAGYLYWGLGSSNQSRWIPAFAIVGTRCSADTARVALYSLAYT